MFIKNPIIPFIKSNVENKTENQTDQTLWWKQAKICFWNWGNTDNNSTEKLETFRKF